MKSVSQLRSEGLQVYITHRRYYPGVMWAITRRDALGLPAERRTPFIHGGKTTARVVFPDGREATAIAVCSHKDVFSYRIGRSIALGRALLPPEEAKRREGRMKEPLYVAATLDWCNDRRKEKNKPPLERLPRGRRGDPLSCPCGKATGLYVHSRSYADSSYKWLNGMYGIEVHQVPPEVKRFIVAFDNGKMPQYEEDR